MNIKIRKIYQVEFAAAAVLLTVFIVFDAGPNISKIFSLMRSIQKVRQTVQSMPAEEKEKVRLKLADEHQQMEDGFLMMQQMVDAVQPKIQTENDTPKITLKLEEMATSAGINLLSIKPVTAEAKQGYKSVSIALDLECEYVQLVDFLSEWNSAPFYLTVQELSIVPSGNLSGKLSVHLVVNLLFKG